MQLRSLPGGSNMSGWSQKKSRQPIDFHEAFFYILFDLLKAFRGDETGLVFLNKSQFKKLQVVLD